MILRLLRKAQMSTEMLIIVGVVLLILVAVVGASQNLFLPVSGFGLQQNEQAWQQADVAVVSAVTVSDTVYVTLQNNLRSRVTITSITLDDVALSISTGEIDSGSTQSFSVATSSLSRISIAVPAITYSVDAYGLSGQTISLGKPIRLT